MGTEKPPFSRARHMGYQLLASFLRVTYLRRGIRDARAVLQF